MNRNVRLALDNAVARLETAGVEPAAATCEWLFADRLDCSRAELQLLRAKNLSDSDFVFLETRLQRLEAGEPLAYVLGYAEFRGRRLKVDSRVLIPRPETEQLAGLVLDSSKIWRSGLAIVADVGVGAGCLAITLALEHPGARIVAIDIDQAALEVARANAAFWNVADRIVFEHGDLLSSVSKCGLDAVVANLPYIPTQQIGLLDDSVRDFEPRLALDGGSDGLELVRRLLAQALPALKPGGRIFLEIGHDQGAAVMRMLQNKAWRDARILPDLAGHDRFAIAARS